MAEVKVTDADADVLGMPAGVAQRVVDFYADRMVAGNWTPISPPTRHPSHNDVLEEAARENERLRKALGFYADEANWKVTIAEGEAEHGMRTLDFTSGPAKHDKGEVARRALKDRDR